MPHVQAATGRRLHVAFKGSWLTWLRTMPRLDIEAVGYPRQDAAFEMQALAP
jgi:hypothetical protein